MESVSRENVGIIVDVIQGYLNAREGANGCVVSSEGQLESEIERRAAVALVDGRVNLKVRPWDGGGGARRLQRGEYCDNEVKTSGKHHGTHRVHRRRHAFARFERIYADS